MQEIVQQLEELFLQAVPTVLIILACYLMMGPLFFKPLLKVMAEREARTAGARKAAQAAEAAAAEKVKQYQEALRQARALVYSEQEAAGKKLLDERAAVLKEARNKEAAEVAAGKGGGGQEGGPARGAIASSVGAARPRGGRKACPSAAGGHATARHGAA